MADKTQSSSAQEKTKNLMDPTAMSSRMQMFLCSVLSNCQKKQTMFKSIKKKTESISMLLNRLFHLSLTKGIIK